MRALVGGVRDAMRGPAATATAPPGHAVALRGYDELERRERRKLCRRLIRGEATTSSEEQEEISVLLLMAQGATERQARAEMRLRRRQVDHLRRTV